VTALSDVLDSLVGQAGVFMMAGVTYLVARMTNKQLRQIHTLVNSNLTSSIESELHATNALVQTMEDHMGELTTAERATLEAAKVKVVELHATLNDRLTQTATANRQAK